MKKIWLLLVLVLSCGLIAAGCGDDDDDGGSSDEPAQEQSGGSGDAGGGAGSEDSGGGGGSDDTPDNQEEAIEQAQEQCKQGIATNAPQASDELKADLEKVCDEIENPEDVADALRELCRTAVEESVPAGPAREQANQACDQIVQQQQ